MLDAETRPEERIAILASAVADAIAAGEVVDRPAAVLKELVENAIDAAATQIRIRVDDAGRDLIEVADDGWGMPADELALAFRRHATSKIRSVADLRTVRTLGFRGEALASIAAVATVEAVSRVRERGEAARVLVEAGLLREQGVAGGPPGTRIAVRRLFFNTPARLRFLKQPATESAVLVRMAMELALGHPAIAFSLQVDGRRVLSTLGSGDQRAAVAAIYDAEVAAAMLEVEQELVSGLIAPPAVHRATRDHIVILVNGRRIQHRSLAFAVEQAYRGLRDPDRFPIAVLQLRVDPAEVDVNVHPTKREVRFRNEGAMFAAVERACYHALRRSPLYELHLAPGGETLQLRETTVTSGALTNGSPRPPLAETTSVPARAQLPALTYVGQLLNAYLVAEAPGAIVLVDQHAAHERVLFDRIHARLESRAAESQLSLIPQVVDLTPAQAAAFEQNQAWLRALGFDADRFGDWTIRITAVPLELPDAAAATVVVRILDGLDHEVTPDRRLRDTAALLACHSAVRFGDPMTTEAARALLAALAVTVEPTSCPHGRPTALVLPEQQVRRWFKRP